MSEENSQNVILNTSKNTQGIVLNTAKNTQALVMDKASVTQSVVLNESQKVLDAINKPEDIPLMKNVLQEDEDATIRQMNSLINNPGPIGALGCYTSITDSTGDVKTVSAGQTYNVLGDLLEMKDIPEDFMFNLASVAKYTMNCLIYNLQDKGYMSLTDKIATYVPDWGHKTGNICVLNKYKYTTGDDTVSCMGKDGVTSVAILSQGAVPVWNTPEELKTLKAQLQPINRDITIQDLMYHTSGKANSSFAPQVTPLLALNGFRPAQFLSNSKNTWDYPSYIGNQVTQPGTSVIYDQGPVELTGIVEIIYNHKKNLIPLTRDMDESPNWMSIEQIFQEEVGNDLEVKVGTDYKFQVHQDKEIASRTQPYINENDNVYFIKSFATIVDDLTELGVPNASDPAVYFNAKCLPTGGLYNAVAGPKTPWLFTSNLYSPTNANMPDESKASDLSGRGCVFSRKFIANLYSIIDNNGTFNGKRILSSRNISLFRVPVHPPEFNKERTVDGNGLAFFLEQFTSSFIFTTLGVTFARGSWMFGYLSLVESGYKTLIEIGASACAVKYGNDFSVLTTASSISFYYTLYDLINNPENTAILSANINSEKVSDTLLWVNTLLRNLPIKVERDIDSGHYNVPISALKSYTKQL